MNRSIPHSGSRTIQFDEAKGTLPSAHKQQDSVSTSGASLAPRGNASSDGIANAHRLRHWTFAQLRENSHYWGLESEMFARNFRNPPSGLIPDAANSGKVSGLEDAEIRRVRRFGGMQARLDVLLQHYIWPYNAVPDVGLDVAIPETEAALLQKVLNDELHRRPGQPRDVEGEEVEERVPQAASRGSVWLVSAASPQPHTLSHPEAEGEDGGEPDGAHPVTSFGGTPQGAMAAIHDRHARALHMVLHDPGAPSPLPLTRAIASYLHAFTTAFPVERLMRRAHGGRGRSSSPSRSHSPSRVSTSMSSAASAAPTQSRSVYTPGTGKRSPTRALEAKTGAAFSAQLQSPAVVTLASNLAVYLFWTHIHPFYSRTAALLGVTTDNCKECIAARNWEASEKLSAELAQENEYTTGGLRSGQTYQRTSHRKRVPVLKPDLECVAIAICSAWLSVEASLSSLPPHEVAVRHPCIQLAVRCVVEAWASDAHPWHALLLAVTGAVMRQYPAPRSAGLMEVDCTGLVPAVVACPPLHRVLDGICALMLDPSRLGGHVSGAESGDEARSAGRRVKLLLARAARRSASPSAGASNKHKHSPDHQSTRRPESEPQTQSQSYPAQNKQWLIATSTAVSCALADPQSPEARRFLRNRNREREGSSRAGTRPHTSGGLSSISATRPLTAVPAMTMVMEKISNKYANALITGVGPIGGFTAAERLDSLHAGSPHRPGSTAGISRYGAGNGSGSATSSSPPQQLPMMRLTFEAAAGAGSSYAPGPGRKPKFMSTESLAAMAESVREMGLRPDPNPLAADFAVVFGTGLSSSYDKDLTMLTPFQDGPKPNLEGAAVP